MKQVSASETRRRCSSVSPRERKGVPVLQTGFGSRSLRLTRLDVLGAIGGDSAGTHVDAVGAPLGLPVQTQTPPGGEVYGEHADLGACPLQDLRQRVARKRCGVDPHRSLVQRPHKAGLADELGGPHPAVRADGAHDDHRLLPRNSRAAGGIVGRMLLPMRSAIERTPARSCTSISPGGILCSRHTFPVRPHPEDAAVGLFDLVVDRGVPKVHLVILVDWSRALRWPLLSLTRRLSPSEKELAARYTR